LNKLNYRRIFIFALLILLVFTISGCKKNEEGLVAKVDGDGITLEEFENDYQIFKRMYEQQLGEGAMAQVDENGKTLDEKLKEDIIEKLIMERLLAKESNDMNIIVSDEEVKEHVNEYIIALESKEKFDSFLEENKLTQESFENNLKKELLLNKHRKAFLDDLDINDEEIKEYFNDNKENLIVVKASHILVKTEEDGKLVLKRLKAGEEFASLAATESVDSQSALQGGNLGYFKRKSYVNEFEEVAFALEFGEISGLVKTEIGYHIIKVEDRKDTLETLKDDIIIVLKEDKYLEKIESLRNNAKVKIYLDFKTK